MRRRGHAFVRLGEAGPAGLDLPKRQRRTLALAHAWLEVAGPGLAARVQATGVRQGVLELEAAHAGWRRAVLSELPVLAARVAAREPALGIRKVRLRVAGEADTPEAVPAAERVAPEPPPAPAAPAAARPEAPSDEPAQDRLERLARAYLERASRAGPVR